MSLTPNTSATSYLGPAAYLSRCDLRWTGDVCSDNGVRVTPAALLTDPNLAATLLDASGMLEAAVTAGERYQPADIAALVLAGGAGQGLVYRLLTAITTALLWERRPDVGPMPPSMQWAESFLEQLSQGSRVLPFVETQAAGLLVDDIETAADVDARFLVSLSAARLFGRRNNRECPPLVGER